MGNPFSSRSSNQQSTAQPTASTGAGANSTALAAGGNISVDPQVTQQAVDAITALVGQALQNQGDVATGSQQTIQNQTGDLSNLVSAVLAKDQTAAASTASGGQTDTNSTILKAVGIAAAAMVAILIFPRSHAS